MIRCYVTDRRLGDVVTFARRAIDDGVNLIQIREKDLPARELLELTCRVRDFAKGSQTRVLVNDRLDVALACGIDGVHLPANGLPAERVRAFVKLVGVSAHSLDEVLAAERAGADFVIFGPVFETPGKQPVGLEALKRVTAGVRIPVLAIGGITAATVPDIMQAGAAGFAAIRMFSS